MQIVNIHEAKTRMSALLAEIEKTGEDVVICRNGTPIADLVPHRSKDRLQTHPVMGNIKINYDPTEPLTDDEWSGETL